MSYTALYKGTRPILRLAAGSEGGSPWVRPAWPSLGDLTATNNTFEGIYGVENSGDNFVSLVVTTDSGTYTVDWGDGTIDSGIASNFHIYHIYDYATVAATVVGEFKPVLVTVTTSGGNITSFSLGQVHPLHNFPSSQINWLDIAINASSMTNLVIAQASFLFSVLEQAKIYNHSVTVATLMFQDCYSLQSVPLFDTSAVTNMPYMFYNCRSLKSVPLFNTSAVTIMNFMFQGCSSLQSVPCFNTSAVQSMQAMFRSCYSLQSVPLFDTSAVVEMHYMFENCYSLQSVPSFNTPTLAVVYGMFLNCFSLQSVPLFDTSGVTFFMDSMFENCYSLRNVPLFHTSCISLSNMFLNCFSLISVPLFDTSVVNNMSNMFQNCYSLQGVPLFDTSSVDGSLNDMFLDCVSLCFGRTDGLQYSISYQGCKLSTAALDDIFTGLGTASETITITGNPGAATCDTSIATAKGWTVIN